mmetsp:Transcript_149412/g.461238  ORF Transcript_149412/g.461238 Transcript_149412/m.461238 type:complete len:200 (+) Transcript_149412:705-1304(+)
MLCRPLRPSPCPWTRPHDSAVSALQAPSSWPTRLMAFLVSHFGFRAITLHPSTPSSPAATLGSAGRGERPCCTWRPSTTSGWNPSWRWTTQAASSPTASIVKDTLTSALGSHWTRPWHSGIWWGRILRASIASTWPWTRQRCLRTHGARGLACPQSCWGPWRSWRCRGCPTSSPTVTPSWTFTPRQRAGCCSSGASTCR